jgi:peptide/nickel transport system permease protein
MGGYVFRRVLQTIPVLIGLSALSFGLLHLTGDPAALLLSPESTAETRAAFRAEHGLDDPLYLQYGRFLVSALHGDFGTSLRYGDPALDLYLERLPATIELSATALISATLIGIPIGALAAVRRESKLDTLIRGVAVLGQAVPSFYLGLLLIIAFGVGLHLLPTSGREGLDSLVLPSVTLATFLLAQTARFTRSSVLEVLRHEYVRTARAKGLAERVILYRHALKNALIPIVTVIGLQVGTLFGGAVVTETVFAWPGIGRLVVQAVGVRDFPLVQVTVMLTGLIFVLVNLAVDLIYAYVDPRIRFSAGV